jgi:M6 family metalloprotease-like protein
MSVPFHGKIFDFTQPDGAKFQVRGFGDQNYAVFETLDGYTVTKNPQTGYYEVARVSSDGTMLEAAGAGLDGGATSLPMGLRINRDAARARGQEGVQRFGGRRCDERRAARKNLAFAARALDGPFAAPPQRGTVGDFVGLCLLIEFPDVPGAISREEVERFCNQSGYSNFGNNGSVNEYFLANSLNRCNYTNIVAPYYRATHNKAYYTDPNIQQGVRARQLIVEALTSLKASNFDFSGLTPDNGGFVYAMNVFYAGEVENNWSEGLWPHAWHLATPVPLATGRSAYDYQFTDMSTQLTLGTFCHENGHMLCDYPDLYDYGNESSGAGAYCLMCAGGNINDRNPTHISAYLKRISGWAQSVTPLQHGATISLRAGQNEFALLSKTTGEYFIIENRRKTARDISLPDEGLAIWHVDEDGNNSNEQMTASQHYELSLEQADGKFHLERSRLLGDGSDLYGEAVKRFHDASVPGSRWWDGSVSKLDIFEISNPGDTMTFKVAIGGVVTPPPPHEVVVGSSAPGRSIPDNTTSGLTDSITLLPDSSIMGVKVAVDITHTFRGDLRVSLLPPTGDAILLHQRSGGNADDLKVTYDEASAPGLTALIGRSTRGTWKLQVQDLAASDIGSLNRWSLEFPVAGSQGPVVLEESPGTLIPDNVPTGIQRSLVATNSGSVGTVEVALNITHTYIGDLQVSLVSPSGTRVVLHNGTGESADNIVRTYTSATTPTLNNLAGQPIRGNWTLRVADRAAQDVGKLNSWKITIHQG